MITWTKPEEALPRIDENDNFNKENKISIRVLVAVTAPGISEAFKKIAFANYYHKPQFWSIEGYTGKGYKIIAWTAIDFPEFE